jgi:hypothetical protein
MEKDESQEQKVWRAKGKTAGNAVPEGPKRQCPNCGSTKLRILTEDKEVTAFYKAFEVPQPVFTLTPPRQCKSCGHLWEVTPSKFMLLLALFVVSVGFVIGVVAAIGLLVSTIQTVNDPESKGSANDYILGAGFAVLFAGFAVACVFGFRFYLAKLRKSQRSEV